MFGFCLIASCIFASCASVMDATTLRVNFVVSIKTIKALQKIAQNTLFPHQKQYLQTYSAWQTYPKSLTRARNSLEIKNDSATAGTISPPKNPPPPNRIPPHPLPASAANPLARRHRPPTRTGTRRQARFATHKTALETGA